MVVGEVRFTVMHICGRNAGSYRQFSESESYLLTQFTCKINSCTISPCSVLFSAATICGRLNYFKLQCIKQGSSLILYYYVLVCTCGNSTACCLVTKPGSLLLPPPLFSKPVVPPPLQHTPWRKLVQHAQSAQLRQDFLKFR